MNPLNVFNNCYYPWKNPANWFKNIKMFFRSFKYAYQRATRGYAVSDTWDLDTHYLYLFHDTLNYLADHHWGYPGYGDFDTDEKWTAYLKELADKFEIANEAANKLPTPMGDKWCEWLEQHPSANPWNGTKSNPYGQDMFDEGCKNMQIRQATFEEAWDKMGKVFFHLWD